MKQKFIVRCYGAGVFYGEIASRNGQEAELVNVRQIWRWSGAASLMQLASEGVTRPRDCKVAPIHKWYKQFTEPIMQYVGIAADEPRRLARLKANQISLLAKYGYTEEMAMNKCIEYGLVSPIYENSHRGGGLVLS